MGLFGFGKKEKDKMKDGLEKTRTGFWGSIMNTLTGSKIDDDLYDELEEQLILADVGGVFAGPQTQADAKETARQNLPAIESAARAALDEAGVDAPVRAELCRMYFTTRQYDDLMLPAGDYDAVRVTIGEGAGHNWWCVMYPPICVSAAMAEDMPAFEEIETLNSEPLFKPKLAVVEVFEKLFGKDTDPE